MSELKDEVISKLQELPEQIRGIENNILNLRIEESKLIRAG